MARKITEKKPLSGNRRSHACNATKSTQKINSQVIRENGKKVRRSVSEIRTMRKNEKTA